MPAVDLQRVPDPAYVDTRHVLDLVTDGEVTTTRVRSVVQPESDELTGGGVAADDKLDVAVGMGVVNVFKPRPLRPDRPGEPIPSVGGEHLVIGQEAGRAMAIAVAPRPPVRMPDPDLSERHGLARRS